MRDSPVLHSWPPIVYGHQRQEEQFLNAYRRQAMPRVWLLHGPKGIGKACFAWRFAWGLLSNASDQDLFPRAFKVDVQVDQVAQAMAGGSYMDFLAIDGHTQAITISDSRRIGDFLALRPGRDGYRVIIIDDCERMGREAANALLKSLEEPPQRTIFFLVSHNLGLLPVTILSRCHKMAFLHLNRKDFSAAVGQNHGADLYDLAQGSPGSALNLIDDLPLYQNMQASLLSLEGGGDMHADISSITSALSAAPSQGDVRWSLFCDQLRRRLKVKILECSHHDARQMRLYALWDDVARWCALSDRLYLDKRHVACVMLYRLGQTLMHKPTSKLNIT